MSTRTSTEPGSSAERERAIAMVRDARVGGLFWHPPAGRLGDRPLIVAGTPIGDAAPFASDHDGVFLLDASGRLKRSGTRETARPVDPWSLMVGGARVVCEGDHEIAAVAAIAGIPLTITRAGRFGDVGGSDIDRVAAHLLGTVYRDPFSGEPADLAATVALLALWRRQIASNHQVGALSGISRWKRPMMRRFFWAPRARALPFARSGRTAVAAARSVEGAVAAWPSRMPSDLRARAAAAGVGLSLIEDGFIRSAGLGSALHPPLSIAYDTRGIHYDPSRLSDLEVLLGETTFDPALLERARTLRETIVASGLGKYGTAARSEAPLRSSGRRLVLVAGQVADDLSVRLGGNGMDNGDLLANARAAEPDAEIWFRPHPDVEAGHRRGRLLDGDALRFADRIVRTGGMPMLIGTVDAVHVLTSLAGFEALLRGREVVVHGTPFFAGWGLTRDLGAIPDRRRRILTLDELVAGALLLYPRYLDPVTLLPCPAEILVQRLASQPAARQTPLIRLRMLQGRMVRAWSGGSAR